MLKSVVIFPLLCYISPVSYDGQGSLLSRVEQIQTKTFYLTLDQLRVNFFGQVTSGQGSHLGHYKAVDVKNDDSVIETIP